MIQNSPGALNWLNNYIINKATFSISHEEVHSVQNFVNVSFII